MQSLEQEITTSWPFPKYKVPKYFETTKIINSIVKPPSKILELGCGTAIVPAILSRQNYSAIGVDDLNDSSYDKEWRNKVTTFLKNSNVEYIEDSLFHFDGKEAFDLVLLNDVLEHLVDINAALKCALKSVKRGGYLMLGLPSSVALLKRINCLRGNTIYETVDTFYNHIGPYRGHIREYTPFEAKHLLSIAGLIDVQVQTRNLFTNERINQATGISKMAYRGYGFLSSYTNFRDSIFVWGKKG